MLGFVNRRAAFAPLALVLALWLPGCEKDGDASSPPSPEGDAAGGSGEGQLERDVEEAADATGDAIETAVDETKKGLSKAADAISEGAKKVGDDLDSSGDDSSDR